jgi:signal transduction histidine kinase
MLRNVVGALLFTGMVGFAIDQVSRQTAIAELALEQVELQREQLLQADEAARREVADYLHDTVQATLVVVGLQLRSLAEEVPGEQAAGMRSLVDELETVRMRDIRRASRQLSPDIRAIGLNGALKELASNYADTMRVRVTCEVDVPGDQAQLALAVYRIVEQGLLNAAVHGRPENCEVVVTRSDQRTRIRATPRSQSQSDELPIIVTVTNDGAPLARGHSQGAGSAVIGAWVERFKGSWSLQTVDGQTQMSAIVRFPNAEHKVALRNGGAG